MQEGWWNYLASWWHRWKACQYQCVDLYPEDGFAEDADNDFCGMLMRCALKVCWTAA
jgi:hypothetical protein